MEEREKSRLRERQFNGRSFRSQSDRAQPQGRAPRPRTGNKRNSPEERKGKGRRRGRSLRLEERIKLFIRGNIQDARGGDLCPANMLIFIHSEAASRCAREEQIARVRGGNFSPAPSL